MKRHSRAGDYDPLRADTVGFVRDDEARARTARGNLAAIVCNRRGVDPTTGDHDPAVLHMVADEYRELCAALGLHTPGGRP